MIIESTLSIKKLLSDKKGLILINSIYSSIKKEAEKIVEFYNTNNLSAIADYLGIIILTSKLGEVQGFLQHYNHHFIIHVNENIEHETIREKVIAHELAHYFLHKHLNTFQLTLNTLSFEGTIEREADIFASELLLPDKVLEKEFYYIQNMNIQELAIYFNVDIYIMNVKYDLMQSNIFFS